MIHYMGSMSPVLGLAVHVLLVYAAFAGACCTCAAGFGQPIEATLEWFRACCRQGQVAGDGAGAHRTEGVCA